MILVIFIGRKGKKYGLAKNGIDKSNDGIRAWDWILERAFILQVVVEEIEVMYTAIHKSADIIAGIVVFFLGVAGEVLLMFLWR